VLDVSMLRPLGNILGFGSGNNRSQKRKTTFCHFDVTNNHLEKEN
jgi:hypothetical protein